MRFQEEPLALRHCHKDSCQRRNTGALSAHQQSLENAGVPVAGCQPIDHLFLHTNNDSDGRRTPQQQVSMQTNDMGMHQDGLIRMHPIAADPFVQPDE